jgi:hypothetical protein
MELLVNLIPFIWWASLLPSAAPILVAVDVSYGNPDTTSPIA